MTTLVQRAALFLTLSAAIPSVPVLMAQQPSATPVAPIPAQIIGAKKVFISNAGDDDWTIPRLHAPNLTYSDFYADIKAWGKYELVTSPADADVVFEIRSYDSRVAGMRLSLSILDPKSRIILWTLAQNVEGVSREATARKNFDDAVNTLVGDLKKLVAASQ